MEESIKQELETLTKVPEAERDETQQKRFKELSSWATAEKTAEEKSKEITSAWAQKDHFEKKFTESEKVRIELEEKLKGNGGAPPAPMPTDPLEIVNLGKALKDFDADETAFIIQHATDKTPKGIIEASKSEWVVDAITARREKVAKQNATLPPSAPGSPGGMFRILSPTEVAKLPKDQYDKYLENLKNQKPQESTTGGEE